VADMLPWFYRWTEERNDVADFPVKVSTGELLSILSTPSYKTDNTIFAIFKGFSFTVWVLTMLSLLSICLINSIKSKEWKIKSMIVIDCVVALLGKGDCSVLISHFSEFV